LDNFLTEILTKSRKRFNLKSDKISFVNVRNMLESGLTTFY